MGDELQFRIRRCESRAQVLGAGTRDRPRAIRVQRCAHGVALRRIRLNDVERAAHRADRRPAARVLDDLQRVRLVLGNGGAEPRFRGRVAENPSLPFNRLQTFSLQIEKVVLKAAARACAEDRA